MSPTSGESRDRRIDARGAMIAAAEAAHASYVTANAIVITQIAAAVTVMATVSLNTISNQNITDINAALAAAEAARVTTAANEITMWTAIRAAEADTAESRQTA